MLKNFLKEKNISIYRLAKEIDEPYSTINDLVNGKVDIEDCKVKLLKKISDYLGQTMEETYLHCNVIQEVFLENYQVRGYIIVKHKKYYVQFADDGINYDIEICKVTEMSSKYIAEVAKYEMEKLLSKKKMEKCLCSM